jgi:putative transcriptional regulator
MRPDGILLRVLSDGAEQPIPSAPPAPMTEAEIETAAVADPDAQPLTESDLSRLRPVSRARTVRRALGMTQEDFAAQFQIPLGTLRDWEQGRAEPDQPARAYLKAIAGDPAGVQRALQRASLEPR